MVLDRENRRGRYNGHLWCFVGTRPLVGYAFNENSNADEVAPYIAAIDGFIQGDDYKGYSTQVSIEGMSPRVLVPPERRLGCMMRVRRRFHDALKLGDERALAHFFHPELDTSGRLALRAARSTAWLTQLERWIDEHEAKVLPTSKLGEACRYARQQRPFLRRCFTDGRLAAKKWSAAHRCGQGRNVL